MKELTSTQQEAISAGGSSFLLGLAGSGKSTALHRRLLRLLQEGEPAYTVLVLVAEAENRHDFLAYLQQNSIDSVHDLEITTYTFLAREMVRLFWPLVARPAGFHEPSRPPLYLHYDLAQLLMWQIVMPMLREGAFADLRLRPQQIVSQVLDTLNRAAFNRLTLKEAEQRQLQSWAQEPEEIRHLQEATQAAQAFRQHCRQHNLLDVSLAIRVFDTQLLQHPEFHRYFGERFQHIIVDNIEEQTPAGQQFIAELMNEVESTAIACDAGGGYKSFLSADPQGAMRFRDLSDHFFHFEEQFVSTVPLAHLANAVERYLEPGSRGLPSTEAPNAIGGIVEGRYRHEMAQKAARFLGDLLNSQSGDGLAPQQVAIVAPGLDDALLHTLSQELSAQGLPYTILRRRSTPRDEPRVRAWLTFLALAHPEWETPPSAYDVAEALSLSHDDLDPARAELVVRDLYVAEQGILLPVSEMDERTAARIGEDNIVHVETVRQWLEAHRELSVDNFLERLFQELLAQPSSHQEPDAAGALISEWFVTLAQELQQSAPRMELDDPAAIGRALLTAVNEGLVSSDPPALSQPAEEAGILIATTNAYLLENRTSYLQLWLDVSSTLWWETPRQPLSNVFVLTPQWTPGRGWTMADDYALRNRLLSNVVRGLTARCRGQVVLGRSILDNRGQRQEGPLWRALRPLLKQQQTSSQ